MILHLFCTELFVSGGGIYPSIPFAIQNLVKGMFVSGTYVFHVQTYEEPAREGLYETTLFNVTITNGVVTLIQKSVL